MRIVDMYDETPDVRTLKLQFLDEEIQKNFNFMPGQFGEYSVFGAGECTFCIASSPTVKDYIECSFKLMGKVTSALRNLEIGDVIGFRGPYGNYFPVDSIMLNKNLVFIGGGIGMAPIKTVLEYCLHNRDKYGSILLLNGARTVADIVYKSLTEHWAKFPDVKVVLTVDPGGETPDWKGEVGLIPPVLEKLAPKPENTIAIMCGPPIMIKFTLLSLHKLGFKPDQIITTLENKMKCGLGKCGRCNVGPYYVCKDGPVFTAEQLQEMPKDF